MLAASRALVAAPIRIDAAMRLARRQLDGQSSTGRRLLNYLPTDVGWRAIIKLVIAPWISMHSSVQMRDRRDRRSNTKASG